MFAKALALLALTLPLGAQSLDYDIFKSKVEPIFLKKRPGLARCVVCHSAANNAFKLQPLAEGSKTWTEEQSRKNFDSIDAVLVKTVQRIEDMEKNLLGLFFI